MYGLRFRNRLWLALTAAGVVAGSVFIVLTARARAQVAPATQTASLDFESGVPSGMKTKGDVSVVTDIVHGGAKSLRVAAGGSAEIPVAAKPSYGTVTIWTYDSGKQLDKEKQYAFGPLVGLMDADGGVVAYGRIYAPYLAGNHGYGMICTSTGGWDSRRWAGGAVKLGWHQWTFEVMSDGLMEVKLDGRRLHAESAEMPQGFTKVVVYGGRVKEFADPAIVDDVSVTVAGEMKPNVIERKPLPGTFDIPFRKELIGKHPRLFFTADELPALRLRCQTTHKKFFDATLAYGQASLTVPPDEPWLKDDTNAQRWGWWKMPTIAFLSELSNDARYRQTTKQLLLAICRSRHFQSGGEADCGMGAANVLAGAAIGYDVVYNDLTPDERKFVQDKLWYQVHRLHEQGFMEKDQSAHYWQQDPLNNHLWHRMAGLTLASLALYGDVPEIDGYLSYAIDKAKWISQWLPEDGSNHEAVGYQAFGTQYLIPTLWALQRCTTVDLLTGKESVHQLPYFRAHMVLPDRQHVWDYGDGGRDVGWFNHYQFLIAGLFHDPYAQALQVANYDAAPNSFDYQCWNLLFYDAALQPAPLTAIPTWHYFPDLEVATFRRNWTDPAALAAFFKCGPYGGHSLNRYRDSFKPPHYVNVAHDHPDAAEFMVFWKGQYFAMDSDYAHRSKSTADHNTILVNGKGQIGSDEPWTQPVDDMDSHARIAQFFGAPGYGMVRGEAAKAYNGLSAFDRTLLYVDDAYLVVHDFITAKTPSTIDWLYNCDGEWKQDAAGSYTITKGGASFRVQMLEPSDLTCAIGLHVADGGRGEKKTQLKATVKNLTSGRILALLSPVTAEAATVSEVKETDSGVLLRVRRGADTDTILIGTKNSPLAIGDYSTDAETAVISQRDGAVTAALLIGGSRLSGPGVNLELAAPANVLVRRNGDNLAVYASMPPRQAPSQTRLTLGFPDTAAIRSATVNGAAVQTAPAGGRVQIPLSVPSWKTLQDPRT